MFVRPGEIIEFLKEKKYIHQGLNGADFGCGSGYFTTLLANVVGVNGNIYAIDIDDDALNSARELAKNLRIKNIRFLKQDLEKSSGLNPLSLDFVFASQILYQSDKPELVIKEAFRILKNNGVLIILEPTSYNYLFFGQNIHQPEKIEKICEEVGFKLIEKRNLNNYILWIYQK